MGKAAHLVNGRHRLPNRGRVHPLPLPAQLHGKRACWCCARSNALLHGQQLATPACTLPLSFIIVQQVNGSRCRYVAVRFQAPTKRMLHNVVEPTDTCLNINFKDAPASASHDRCSTLTSASSFAEGLLLEAAAAWRRNVGADTVVRRCVHQSSHDCSPHALQATDLCSRHSNVRSTTAVPLGTRARLSRIVVTASAASAMPSAAHTAWLANALCMPVPPLPSWALHSMFRCQGLEALTLREELGVVLVECTPQGSRGNGRVGSAALRLEAGKLAENANHCRCDGVGLQRPGSKRPKEV